MKVRDFLLAFASSIAGSADKIDSTFAKDACQGHGATSLAIDVLEVAELSSYTRVLARVAVVVVVEDREGKH